MVSVINEIDEKDVYHSFNPLGCYVCATVGEHGQQLLGLFKDYKHVCSLFSLIMFISPDEWDQGGSVTSNLATHPALWVNNPGAFIVHTPEGYWLTDINTGFTADPFRGLYIVPPSEEAIADSFWLA